MKQTEIGLIPDDWEVRVLGDICDVRDGTHDSPIYYDFGYPFITSKNLINGRIDFTDIQYISKNDYDKINERSKVDKNDILFSMIGTIGKSVLVLQEPNFAIKNVALFKNINKCNQVYLKQYLDSDICYSRMNEDAKGSTQTFIPLGYFRTFLVPFPPLAEQHRIAKALSDVDALISTTEKLIQKKKNIKQGTMQNLLTGKKRLPGFGPQTKSPAYKQTELGPIPEDWEVKSLNLLGTILRGVSYKPEDASEKKISNYIPLLRSNNVFDSRINFSNLVYIKPHCVHQIQYMSYGDILICAANGSASLVGKNAYYNKTDTVTFGAFMSVFRCFENQNHSFIRYLFQTDLYKSYLKEILAGSAINNLTPKNLLNLSFSLPSSLQEQTAIANVLSSMDKEIETLNTKLEKYHNLKTAMMQQLLTGKIRLIK